MPKKTISDLNIRITASANGLATGVKSAKSEIKGLDDFARRSGDGIKKYFLGIAAAYASVQTFRSGLSFAGDQVLDGIKLAAEAEQAEVAFSTLLGGADEAQKTLKELYDFTASTPFRVDETRDAAQKLIAFGTAGKDVVPTLRSIGDIAAGTGNRIGDIAEIYGKARVQGRLFAEDINQLTGRGIPIIQEFARQLGVAESEVKKLGSDGKITFANLQKAFADLTVEGGKFAGLTAAQADTIPGKYSTLLDKIDALKRGFGEELKPAVKESIALFDDFVGEFSEFDQVGKRVELTITGLTAQLNQMRAQMQFVSLGIQRFLASFGVTDSDLTEEVAYAIADVNRIFAEGTKKAKEVANNGLASIAGDTSQIDNINKKLEESAKKAKQIGDQLRSEYATPFEKFETKIRSISEAFKAGAISEGLATRALTKESEKLEQQVKNLQAAMHRDVGATAQGSAEDLAKEARRLNNVGIDQNAIKKQIDAIVTDLQFEVILDDKKREFGDAFQGGKKEPVNRLADASQSNARQQQQRDIGETLRRNHLAEMQVLRSIASATTQTANKPPIQVNEVQL